MSDLVKKDDNKQSITLGGGRLKAGGTSFQDRVREARRQQPSAQDVPNRLCLMLDCSGSMYGEHLNNLKDAVTNFVNRCDFFETSIACSTFPQSDDLELTTDPNGVTAFATGLTSGGGTPMRACVERCLSKNMTRGIIVSDGDAGDWHRYHYDDWDESSKEPKPTKDELLTKYKEKGIPIDCVHIGASTGGEELLRWIASETGGIYLKFTDVSAFSTAFAYLTPGYRAMLTSGKVDAASLGAKEVR